MENVLTMLFHSIVIGIILYIGMIYLFKQPQMVAENRSIFIYAFVLLYMIILCHGLPTKINNFIFT